MLIITEELVELSYHDCQEVNTGQGNLFMTVVHWTWLVIQASSLQSSLIYHLCSALLILKTLSTLIRYIFIMIYNISIHININDTKHKSNISLLIS